MKHRYLWLAIAILLLGVLNLWQWKAPAGSARERGRAIAGAVKPDDLQLKVGLAVADSGRSGRNLFQPRSAVPVAPVRKKVELKVEAPPPPPAKTPEQIAEEAARAELGEIKLVGVVFRGEKGQAFLVKGDQVYMVNAGGKVGERFEVEAIGPDSIRLKDPATRVNGQIPVSGK